MPSSSCGSKKLESATSSTFNQQDEGMKFREENSNPDNLNSLSFQERRPIVEVSASSKTLIAELVKRYHILFSADQALNDSKKAAWEEIAEIIATKHPDKPKKTGIQVTTPFTSIIPNAFFSQIRKRWHNWVARTRQIIRNNEMKKKRMRLVGIHAMVAKALLLFNQLQNDDGNPSLSRLDTKSLQAAILDSEKIAKASKNRSMQKIEGSSQVSKLFILFRFHECGS